MKTTCISLAVLSLFGFCLVGYGQEILTEQRSGGDEPGMVHAPTASPTAEEVRLLEDLDAARRAGDVASAKVLQDDLDLMHGAAANDHTVCTRKPHEFLAFTPEGDPPPCPLWSGDVKINYSGAYPPDTDLIKPSLAHAPDGVLYAAAEGLSDTKIYVFKSLDGGASWSWIYAFWTNDDLRNPSMAYVENAGGNLLCISYEKVIGALHGVYVCHLNVDTMERYHTEIEWGFAMSGSEEVHPRICTDSFFYTTYYIYVTYARHQSDYHRVMFSRSTDHGVTYSAPVDITGGSQNSTWPTRPDIDYGTSGLFVAFEKPGWNGSGWVNQPWVRESNNFGSSFLPAVQLAVSAYPGYHPAVAAAWDNSTVVVAYTKEYPGDMDIRCAYSNDGGSSWFTEIALPWTYGHEMSVDLYKSDGNGRFHAAYHMDLNNVFYTYAACGDPSTWHTGTIINDFATVSSDYPQPSVCINPTLPVSEEGCVVWTDYRNGYYSCYFDKEHIPPLSVDRSAISAALGGSINFWLDAGPENAQRNYLIAGGATGTEPGQVLPGGYATIPVNFDDFTYLVVFPYLNSDIFQNFLGKLNASGMAQATLWVPPIPGWEDLVMHYAFCCNNLFDYVSNPVQILIIP
ncbi:MAG: glycoside hydrolase [Planctomycetes bacterium]|nr:glycoside hydrolase [Planctomycetota bacterium]